MRPTILLARLIAFVALGFGFSSPDIARAEPTAATNPAIVLDAGEGEPIAFPLHPARRLAFAKDTESQMSFFEMEIPARSGGAPPHRHSQEDEFFYVRQGRVTFMTEGRQKTIGAGGFVLLPRNGWHAVWNASEENAIMLVGTSAGAFDDFFDAVAMEVASAGELSPPEVGAIVGRLGAERGITIDMSRLPANARALYGLPPTADE